MNNVRFLYHKVVDQSYHDLRALKQATNCADQNVKVAALRIISLVGALLTGILLPITFTAMIISLLSFNPLNIIPFLVNLSAFGGLAFAYYHLQPETIVENVVHNVETRGVETGLQKIGNQIGKIGYNLEDKVKKFIKDL